MLRLGVVMVVLCFTLNTFGQQSTTLMLRAHVPFSLKGELTEQGEFRYRSNARGLSSPRLAIERDEKNHHTRITVIHP